MPDHVELRSASARLSLDLRVGHIRSFQAVGPQGGAVEVLHRAPWADDPAAWPDGMAPVDRHLSGDFLCAPFGTSDPSGPPHGWGANSEWQVIAPTAGDAATLRLGRKIAGASVQKTLRLAPNAALLYQRHKLTGGSGALPLAHHAMVAMRAGGGLFFSPKLSAATPDAPLVRDRHLLAYPALAQDLRRFPGRDGGAVDLTRYPTATGTEDFVMLVEPPDAPLGWTAVLRRAERDIVFVLKHPRELPVTMLWLSNGGRLDPPWNGPSGPGAQTHIAHVVALIGSTFDWRRLIGVGCGRKDIANTPARANSHSICSGHDLINVSLTKAHHIAWPGSCQGQARQVALVRRPTCLSERRKH